MLGGSRKNQILQTVIARLNQGMSGPPDSYPEEETGEDALSQLISDFKKAGVPVDTDNDTQ